MCKKLSSRELNKLAVATDKLEWQLLNDWGLRKISGGYVIVEMYDYNEEKINLEVTSGVDGSGESGSSINLDMCRKTFEVIK